MGWGRAGTQDAKKKKKKNFPRGQMLTKAKTFLNSRGTAPARLSATVPLVHPNNTPHLPSRRSRSFSLADARCKAP